MLLKTKLTQAVEAICRLSSASGSFASSSSSSASASVESKEAKWAQEAEAKLQKELSARDAALVECQSYLSKWPADSERGEKSKNQSFSVFCLLRVSAC